MGVFVYHQVDLIEWGRVSSLGCDIRSFFDWLYFFSTVMKTAPLSNQRVYYKLQVLIPYLFDDL